MWCILPQTHVWPHLSNRRTRLESLSFAQMPTRCASLLIAYAFKGVFTNNNPVEPLVTEAVIKNANVWILLTRHQREFTLPALDLCNVLISPWVTRNAHCWRIPGEQVGLLMMLAAGMEHGENKHRRLMKKELLKRQHCSVFCHWGQTQR